MNWCWVVLVNLLKFIVIQERIKFSKSSCILALGYLLAFIVYGAFKSTSSISPLLIFVVSGVFWLFWDHLLFLFSLSAILLGDVIALKTKDSRRVFLGIPFLFNFGSYFTRICGGKKKGYHEKESKYSFPYCEANTGWTSSGSGPHTNLK